MERWHARGLAVGRWVWATDPAADVALITDNRVFWPAQFAIYDTESPYKEDETPGGFKKAAELVAAHPVRIPAAVTSYGAYKTTIDFKAFANAGWPIFAQVYESFKPGDEQTYRAVYPQAGIHQLTRSLTLQPGQAVYRPEGI